jgi:hypothetical protein
MLFLEKKFALCATTNNSNSERNNPPTCKLNGRSLSDLLFFNAIFGGYAMTRTTYIRRDVNEVRFVLDVHAYLNFYSSSSLQQTSAGKHVASLGHIILIRVNNLMLRA